MSRLAGYPSGLLSLTGSQNFGINPKELSDSVVPVVDIGELYAVTQQVVLSDNLNPVPGTGFRQGVPVVSVPVGELWRVLTMSVIAITPAASTITFAPAAQIQANVLFMNDPISVVASSTRWSVSKLPPAWFGPGTSFGVYVGELTGAAVITGISLLAARVRA